MAVSAVEQARNEHAAAIRGKKPPEDIEAARQRVLTAKADRLVGDLIALDGRLSPAAWNQLRDLLARGAVAS